MIEVALMKILSTICAYTPCSNQYAHLAAPCCQDGTDKSLLVAQDHDLAKDVDAMRRLMAMFSSNAEYDATVSLGRFCRAAFETRLAWELADIETESLC